MRTLILAQIYFSLLALCFFSGLPTVFGQTDFVVLDTALVQLDNCDDIGGVCVDMPLGMTADYIFYDNGELYEKQLAGCDFDTVVAYTYTTLFGQGEWGPYELDSWEVNGVSFSGQFMDITALVNLMNTWDPTGNWEHEPASQLIVGGNANNTYSVMNVTVVLINSPSIIGYNLGFEPKGSMLFFDNDTHEVVIEEIATGDRDTFYVLVACPSLDEEYVTINVGENDVYCVTTDELLGDLVSIDNICPTNAGIVNFQLIGTNCVEYTGFSVGVDTACLVVCDPYDFCDTTLLIVTVEPSSESNVHSLLDYREVQVYHSDSYCYDLGVLGNTVNSTNNLCQEASLGDEIHFEPINETTYCINYTGMRLGFDSICYSFIDENNDILNTTLIVRAVQPLSETIIDTINLGESYNDCLDLSDLGSDIDQIYNNCEEFSGNVVLFDINNVSLCVDVESLSVGTEKACIIMCDDAFVCDTTFYQITVVDDAPTLFPPNARSDEGFTSNNSSVVINVCENDVIPDNYLTDYYILPIAQGGSGPNHGTVMFNDDCTVLYQPNGDFCDGIDRFTYVICNEAGCDEAEVIVNISCHTDTYGVNVFTGVSPNNDGMNDTFTIYGLESYPNHSIYVYSRWGLKIFEAQNYQNDWDGVWDGNHLPDGTYFYSIVLDDDKKLSGYLQIQR